jgi:hypothetical protein
MPQKTDFTAGGTENKEDERKQKTPATLPGPFNHA